MSQQHISGEPLTTSVTNEAAPGLLLNEIDRRVVRIRPSATPLDQISRMGGSRTAGAMKVEYYSVDTKPIETSVKAMTVAATPHAKGKMTLADNAVDFLDVSETFMAPGPTDTDGNPLVFYVVSHDKGTPDYEVIQVNFDETGKPADISGEKIVRMGRAATELDVQTPQFQALPKKEWNLCQIFKAQVEESTLHRLTNKEVGWTFSDQEEVAIIDMRLGMEKNFLFGRRMAISDPVKGEDVSLTGGIWNQTTHRMGYTADLDPDEFARRLVRNAFNSNTGSRRKILMAGSDLIDKLSRQTVVRAVGPAESVTKWGIDFTEISSKFGKLYVVHSEIFDQCGLPGHGMVIDPDYIAKYCFIPMQAERLELKRSGQRNTDAIVITEASCLVLRHPATHMRVCKE